jgi:UDP-N-acetylglucosamine transferase subunit ALG13
VIVAAVGTFLHGFDELVEAADRAVAALGVEGFAQVGHGRYLPVAMTWGRFLPPDAFTEKLRRASVIVCHGGMGILGDAMRAGRPIVAMPRRGAPSRAHPANDQTVFVRRLAERWPIEVCEDPADLARMLGRALALGPGQRRYALKSNVPRLVADFLARSGEPRP